ncbi:hypothetical protein DEU56DRAFT_750619 [Suillus clintonianus]|uniref:uncharacterized protein n=1 Tax=Suillus clintonianus TaxID=1904413 RepID=UPI001B861DBC|nr:uncharacterized protein DEU56DRAFT_750619 [Suillus clintonianus]KAG2157551.1 hypothetical protein DEU56DRAFT_750619 [Suillus clintonianus]
MFRVSFPAFYAKYEAAFLTGRWTVTDPGPLLGRVLMWKLQVMPHQDLLHMTEQSSGNSPRAFKHGLIWWKIMIHGFIDGYSQYITGLRAHNNNHAQTVLELFQDISGKTQRYAV